MILSRPWFSGCIWSGWFYRPNCTVWLWKNRLKYGLKKFTIFWYHKLRKPFLYGWRITWVFILMEIYTNHLESIFFPRNILSLWRCEIKMASLSLQMWRNIALFPRQHNSATTARTLGRTEDNFGLSPSDERKFKMASTTRAKLARLLPSFLHARSYCHAVAMENFLYHPKCNPLEPEVQTLYLTKTVNMGDVSSCLQDTSIHPTSREAMMSKFRQSIIQTRLLNFEGEVSMSNMCALPLMQNMLRVVWSYTNG